jgi:hypothetical protein
MLEWRDRNQQDEERGNNRGKRVPPLYGLGQYVVTGLLLVLGVTVGVQVVGALVDGTGNVIDRLMSTYWGWIDDLFRYGPFSKRGTKSLVPFVLVTFAVGAIVKMILRRK